MPIPFFVSFDNIMKVVWVRKEVYQIRTVDRDVIETDCIDLDLTCAPVHPPHDQSEIHSSGNFVDGGCS